MTPREPDRFDKQGDDLACAFQTVRCPDRRTLARQIAAALRAAESSTLERAAHGFDAEADDADRRHSHVFLGLRQIAERLRALIPSAAAPAGEGK